MSNSGPIGVFDSGVGGLSILEKIQQILPGEDLLYVADSAHAPYGSKGSAYIQERCREIMAFFQSRDVKAVVLACNTATAAAVAWLRATYPIPIIGMEPAVKPAAAQSRSGVIGVLATAGTIESDKFLRLKSQFTDSVEIITVACHGLVEGIEAPEPDREHLRDLLASYISPLLAKGADHLVLGCTHYALLMELINEVAGNRVTVMETGNAVARELERRLREAALLKAGPTQGDVSFFSSGTPLSQARLLKRYWGQAVAVNSLPAQEQLI